MSRVAIIVVSESSLPIAQRIAACVGEARSAALVSVSLPKKGRFTGYHPPLGEPVAVYTKKEIGSYGKFLKDNWQELEAIVFIGALGICTRSIAPALKNKYEDPAVVCIDSTGQYVIPVVSGHIGGANDLARHIAESIGAQAIVTTQSDNEGLWALDTLARQYGWQVEAKPAEMNRAIFAFVEKKPTALLLEIRDAGTDYLERTKPEHVQIFYRREDLNAGDFALVIAVTPSVMPDATLGHDRGLIRHLNLPDDMPLLVFNPPVLHLGFGCRKQCDPAGIPEAIEAKLREAGLSPKSIATVGTVELKKDEALLQALLAQWPQAQAAVYPAETLAAIDVPNPSEKALAATGSAGVAEAAAIAGAQGGPLRIEKQKGRLSEGNDFTFAVAQGAASLRAGHIEIVGAGPGDPELVSVRGKRFLEQADLILYAGSLVPVELTQYAKHGCTVRSSASMDLEEQFALMKEFYDKGLLVVRLHTGDPCLYGAIQEQMAFFDRYGMDYHITPGISAFQAAAAALRSQFTIPEKVQTIILTRGEGRTPMPEREQLHKLAQSQSTMCIYLSAGIVEEVQAELLQAYPPETPVAACYKLTWKEERIYRGVLRDLAKIVRDNNLTLTTLLVVGDAIGNREGLSRLYAHEFKHLFRK
ncbi:MAG: precorrin-4 C(11)-methyltransferase [Bacteroidales bacterium]|nr:precorrin-4 C(11)-methyltransferase [Bacteroidales bacterium]MBR6424277.1 precorrin-4 C(11)-methyltransferase [Bacteroidales bacterium]